MKRLMAAAFTLIMFASLAPSALAAGHRRSLKLPLGNFNTPHIVHSSTHPNRNGLQVANHHLTIQVQGKALSELSLDFPEGVSIKRGVEITNQSGQKIDVKISVKNRKTLLVFSQPVPPETTLDISMRGVNNPGSYIPHDWQYMVYGKMVGLNAEIPLGTVHVQTL